jgi:hypothetical protein
VTAPASPYGFRSSDITPLSLAQDGDTLGYTDLTKLRRKLPAAYRQFGVFVTSSNGGLAIEMSATVTTTRSGATA